MSVEMVALMFLGCLILPTVLAAVLFVYYAITFPPPRKPRRPGGR